MRLERRAVTFNQPNLSGVAGTLVRVNMFGPAWRRRFLAALATLIVLLAGYWFWFRDSSFARVHDVYVTGLAGPQASSIRNALENAGLDMSSLDVNSSALRAAVADYPVVRAITAEGSFPHKLSIQVDLNLPVAVLQSPSGRKPVAADGLLMPDVPVTSRLPVLNTTAVLPADRVTAGAPFELVRVISLAPGPLRARIKSVGIRPGTGIVAKLIAGPELRFGSSDRLPAKWIAATRVLASPAAKGATYIDVTLPERPVAGGLPTTSVIPLAPAGAPQPAATTTTPTATATSTTPTTSTTTTTPTTTATTPAATTTTPSAGQAASTTSGGAAQAPVNPQPQVQSTTQPSTTG